MPSNSILNIKKDGKGVEIPALKGEDGVTPNITIGTVETLASGSEATASITGTVENPVLNLGIPKGTEGLAPIRGTDYWTAADIAEIKGYVDEAILGGSW